jgi:ubiquinone/menaquinone biosynthesis C-methylase UbiE
MARSVGPDGAVIGVDCCQAFIDDGQAEARRAGLDNLRFVVADAQVLPLEPSIIAIPSCPNP